MHDQFVGIYNITRAGRSVLALRGYALHTTTALHDLCRISRFPLFTFRRAQRGTRTCAHARALVFPNSLVVFSAFQWTRDLAQSPVMAEQLRLRGHLKGHGGWVTQIATSPSQPDMIMSSSRGAFTVGYTVSRWLGKHACLHV